eukprot:1144734-Pelagomonas_calceolata.AAC.8
MLAFIRTLVRGGVPHTKTRFIWQYCTVHYYLLEPYHYSHLQGHSCFKPFLFQRHVGFLLEGLTDFPFCMSASALLDDQLLGIKQQAPLPDSSTQQQEPAAAALTDGSLTWQLASERGLPGRQASLWTAAAHACIKGFGNASDTSHQARCSQQQRQQQEQHSSTAQPSEAGYREWGAHFSKQFLNIRFNCCCFGSLFALIREMLQGNAVKVVLMLVNFMPYIVNFYKPRVGTWTGTDNSAVVL